MADLFEPPPITIEGYDPLFVAIKTRLGTVHAKLFEWKAPRTVRNFVGLATGAITGTPFYDGLAFHRVIRDFMIQGGCPKGDGTGDAGYAIECEFGAGRHAAGSLSMANAGPNTGGSQFFITEKATSWLDFKHAVFGQVASEDDLDVVRRIMRQPVDGDDRPVEPVLIESVTVYRQAA